MNLILEVTQINVGAVPRGTANGSMIPFLGDHAMPPPSTSSSAYPTAHPRTPHEAIGFDWLDTLVQQNPNVTLPCSICLGDIHLASSPRDWVSACNAGHLFHKDCLRQAFTVGNKECPKCKQPPSRDLMNELNLPQAPAASADSYASAASGSSGDWHGFRRRDRASAGRGAAAQGPYLFGVPPPAARGGAAAPFRSEDSPFGASMSPPGSRPEGGFRAPDAPRGRGMFGWERRDDQNGDYDMAERSPGAPPPRHDGPGASIYNASPFAPRWPELPQPGEQGEPAFLPSPARGGGSGGSGGGGGLFSDYQPGFGMPMLAPNPNPPPPPERNPFAGPPGGLFGPAAAFGPHGLSSAPSHDVTYNGVTVSTNFQDWTPLTTNDITKLHLRPADPQEFDRKSRANSNRNDHNAAYLNTRFVSDDIPGWSFWIHNLGVYDDMNRIGYYVLARPSEDTNTYRMM